MAEFNRKELKKIFEAAEIEVPKDVLGQICELHIDSSDGMGDTIKSLKKSLEKAEHERDEALEKAPKEGEETVSKQAYDNLNTEYQNYKADVEKKELDGKKLAAVRKLLVDSNISDKRIDSVLKVYDMEGVELDEKGNIKDAEDRAKAIKSDWADFIVKKKKRGADIDEPGQGGASTMTREEIVAIKDPAERRAAIAKNLDIFEKGSDE